MSIETCPACQGPAQRVRWRAFSPAGDPLEVRDRLLCLGCVEGRLEALERKNPPLRITDFNLGVPLHEVDVDFSENAGFGPGGDTLSPGPDVTLAAGALAELGEQTARLGERLAALEKPTRLTGFQGGGDPIRVGPDPADLGGPGRVLVTPADLEELKAGLGALKEKAEAFESLGQAVRELSDRLDQFVRGFEGRLLHLEGRPEPRPPADLERRLADVEGKVAAQQQRGHRR